MILLIEQLQLYWTQSPVIVILALLLAFLVVTFAAFLAYLATFPKLRKIIPRRADHFRPDLVPSNLDTIVIGSGSGGSCCANLLAQSGQRVLVLEQHTVTGGCTHSFREENCEWDTGLHYVPRDMADKTARAGAVMDFMTHGLQKFQAFDENEPYDEVVFPPDSNVKEGTPNNYSYPFYSGEERLTRDITDCIDPDDETLKERTAVWLAICREINSGFVALGMSRILPKWLHFLVQDRIDTLMTFAAMTVRDAQYAVFTLGYSRDQLLANCPKAPDGPEPDPSIRRLKAVTTHPIGDYAVQPKEATLAAHGVTATHYMDGGSYTIGATQNYSMRATSAVRCFGGQVLVDATVREIIVENGRAVGVRVSNTSALEAATDKDSVPSTEIRAKNVVCATSVYNLYNKLLPQDLEVVQKFQDPNQRSIRQSHGHVFLFCKIKGDADEIGIPKHNIWYFNGYDLDEAFDTYFANPTEVRPPTVYIGFPCTKDKDWKRRFPGTSNCILISDGLYEYFEKWADKPVRHRGDDYMQVKEKLTKHLLDILYEFVPQVRGKVVYHHLGTPLTEVTYLASYRGGSYGTKCTPEMFAPINREWTTNPRTEIPGLYLAGSDAFLPSVTGAMYGGCLGASAVLGHFGTLRLANALLCHLAKRFQEDSPKLTFPQAYMLAWQSYTDMAR